MVVITISGKAQHGKDSAACILKKKLEEKGKKVLIIHYADYLKFICQKYFGWDGNKDEKGRHILQYVGTDIVRKRKPDFWVEIASLFISAFKEDYDYILIPDTRFPNEVEAMKNQFETISIKIVRLDFENILTAEQRLHPSETALDGYQFDYTLLSQDGLDNLEISVEQFIKSCNL